LIDKKRWLDATSAFHSTFLIYHLEAFINKVLHKYLPLISSSELDR
jgi:hypothetical protein